MSPSYVLRLLRLLLLLLLLLLLRPSDFGALAVALDKQKESSMHVRTVQLHRRTDRESRHLIAVVIKLSPTKYLHKLRVRTYVDFSFPPCSACVRAPPFLRDQDKTG